SSRACCTSRCASRRPFQLIVPVSGVWKPVTILISVDLPAPLSPRRPTISFSPTTRSTPSRAWTPRKDLEMSLSSSRLAMCACFGGGTSLRVRWELADQLVHERHERADVLLRDDAGARVDVQPCEVVLHRQADLQDG